MAGGGSVSPTGTLSAAGGADCTLAANSKFSVLGKATFDDGSKLTLALNGNLNMGAGGDFDTSGTTNIFGTMTTASGSTFAAHAKSNTVIDGTANYASTTQFDNGSTLILDATAKGKVVANGTVTSSGTTTGKLGSQWIIEDTAKWILQNGSNVRLHTTVDSMGTCEVDTGANLNLDSGTKFNLAADLDCKGGNVSLVAADTTTDGAQLILTGTANLFEQSGSVSVGYKTTIGGFGTAKFKGILVVKGNIGDNLRITDGDAITVEAGGTMDVSGSLTEAAGGHLDVFGTVTIEPGAALDDSTTITIEPGGSLIDNGTATIRAGGTTTAFGTLSVGSAGLLDIFGTVLVAPGAVYQPQGTVTVEQGGTLTIAAISATSGGGQSATVASAFANPLVATVTDQNGNPVPGVTVTFAAPGSGAGVTFPNGATATTDASGRASVAVSANTIAGGPFTVTTSIGGVLTPASFSLTNTPAGADHLAFSVQPSNVLTGAAISPAVQVQLLDKYGNVLSGDNTDQVSVAVASGPGGFSAGSTTTATASGGVATFNNLILNTPGTYTLSESATGGLTGANSASFVVSWPAISLAQAPQVNGGLAALAGAQRSMVDQIVYTFNHAVSLATGAFTIALHQNVTVNGASGQAVGTLPTLNYSSPDGGVTWVVSFSGAGVVNNSIADGVYDLTLNHAAVSDSQGQALAADRTDTFFRLYGDANGDGTVNNTDTFKVKSSFLKNAGDAGYLAYLDYNGDGTVNNSDTFQLKKRFLTTYGGFTPTL
jgi:hypothetical protein